MPRSEMTIRLWPDATAELARRHRSSIARSSAAAPPAGENNIEFIDNFFFGPTENMDGPYNQYGFEISDLYAYEKDL